MNTKDEKFGLAYVAFCPYHACVHSGGSKCKKWMEMVTARMKSRQQEVADRDAKLAKRKDKYTAARQAASSSKLW